MYDMPHNHRSARRDLSKTQQFPNRKTATAREIRAYIKRDKSEDVALQLGRAIAWIEFLVYERDEARKRREG